MNPCSVCLSKALKVIITGDDCLDGYESLCCKTKLMLDVKKLTGMIWRPRMSTTVALLFLVFLGILCCESELMQAIEPLAKMDIAEA